MPRLQGITVYLSGPIEACQDQGVTWRQRLTPQLEQLEMVVWDPLVKPDWVPPADGTRQSAWKRLVVEPRPEGRTEFSDERSVAFHQNRLLRDVCCALANQCNIMIVRLDRTVFTVGTWEEMMIGQRRGIPIFFLCSDEVPSMWLVDMFNAYDKHRTVFFQTEEALIRHLYCIETDDVKVDNIAWIFKTYRQ